MSNYGCSHCNPRRNMLNVKEINMHQPYTLIEDDTSFQEQVMIDKESPQTPEEQALTHLGFRVEPKSLSDEIKDYFIVDKDDGLEIHSFRDFSYDNACVFALTVLGYSLYEGEAELNFLPSDNILAFEL